jgi:hypothetical protein
MLQTLSKQSREMMLFLETFGSVTFMMGCICSVHGGSDMWVPKQYWQGTLFQSSNFEDK